VTKKILPITGAVVITIILTSTLRPLAFIEALAQPSSLCQTFRETGKTLCGRFLAYWQQNGGLRQFGYPLSEPFTEISELDAKQYTVQYFERAVFEMHPENKPPNDVLLSQLGRLRFDNRYPNGPPGPPYATNLPLYPGARSVQVVYPTNSEVLNSTTFVTTDKGSDVLLFYKEILFKSGWALVAEKPNHLEFLFPRTEGAPIYFFWVDVEPIRGGLTNVKLELWVDGVDVVGPSPP
jgi:hypothetical protein